MATEKDLELLDDYLSNRLEGADKAKFESRLESDASLRSELNVQRELVEGLKKARVVELKSMLNQTIVPPSTASSAAGKITAWVLAATVIGLGSYYLLKENSKPEANDQTVTTTEQPNVTIEEQQTEDNAVLGNAEEKSEADIKAPVEEDKTTIDEPKINEAAKKPEIAREVPQQSAPAIQPEVNPYDPTKELESATDKPELSDELSNAHRTASSITVEVDPSNKKYDFHYRFSDGKLFLLGSFEKDLYEIMEFFDNNKRTVFLYYHANYYLLDETQEKPTPLTAITDPELLKKLRDYRDK
jgi:hypothetical protein